MKNPLLRMLWCESVAPLGNPVVPLVYWMLMGSSKARAASRRCSASGPAPPSAAASASAAPAGRHVDHGLAVTELRGHAPQVLPDGLAEQRGGRGAVAVGRLGSTGHGSSFGSGVTPCCPLCWLV